MDNLKITGTEYLMGDKIITPENVYDLSDEELKTLINTPASLRDILRLRENQHNFANTINNTLGNMQVTLHNIEKSLIVKRVNGKVIEMSISEAVEELLNMHKGERKRIRFIKSLKENKQIIFLIIVVLIGFSIYQHETINLFMKMISSYFIPIAIASISAPLMVIGITRLFTKKKN